jgi:DNA-binding PadR family transcriptional regulator
MTERRIESLLPIRPRVFAILLVLAEGPRHGYGIMRALSAAPGEHWSLGPGTLYRTLKEMQRQRLISSTEGPGEESDGPPRRYYELTPFGRGVAGAEAKRMAQLVARARAESLLPA